MKRRRFVSIATAALFAPLPKVSFAQPATQSAAGYQAATISQNSLSVDFGGMATAQTPVTKDTLFQAASCSKTVTALAVLTLVRDGILDLDAPVNRYLQRWQLPGPRGDLATAAELMSHTAGTTVHGFEGYASGVEIPTLMDILRGRAPANSDPIIARRRWFQDFRYSGGGTTVLQALIEDLSGVDFQTFAAQKVLRPVGASSASFSIMPQSAFAHGAFEDGRPVPGGFMRHPESAAAGLWATAADLAKVLNAILHALDGAKDAILPIPLARRMITPVDPHVGLGLFVEEGHMIYHTGRNFGFDSIMVADLRTKRIQSAMTNRNGALDRHMEQLLTF